MTPCRIVAIVLPIATFSMIPAARAAALVPESALKPPITAMAMLQQEPPNATIDLPVDFSTAIVAGETVQFAGTATDPDGTISSYLWDFGGGAPSQSVEDPGAVLFNTPGLFTVTFTATDNSGLTDSDVRQVFVGERPPPENQPPNATIDAPTANPTVIFVGGTVTFAGSATDDGQIASYLWDFGGGAPNRFVEDPGAVQFNSVGLFTVTFNVTDNTGAVDPSPPSVQVQVNQRPSTNQPPNAVIDSPANNPTIFAGQFVTFAGTGTDPDGDATVASYAWSFQGGNPSSSNAADPGNVRYDTPGVFNVTFSVTDAQGVSDPTPATRSVTVVAPPGNNQPPNATITSPPNNPVIPVNGEVFFSGQATDPDGTIVSYRWDFGGGASNTTAQVPGSVRFTRAGVFTVEFNAFDSFGAADPTPDRRTVTVTQAVPTNEPPQATIEAPVSTTTIRAGETVEFAGSARDPDGRVVAYLWNFAGGAANRNVEDPGPVTFTLAGTYDVVFNVTDDGGASDPTPPHVTVIVRGTGGGGGVCTLPDRNVDRVTPGSEARVDGHDVMFVLRAALTQDLEADVNCDDRVDEGDVQAVLANLGKDQ